ncbi:MAG: hypothetical protein Q9219_007216 [cf. Caloplaca sp. 3 TL-2023]
MADDLIRTVGGRRAEDWSSTPDLRVQAQFNRQTPHETFSSPQHDRYEAQYRPSPEHGSHQSPRILGGAPRFPRKDYPSAQQVVDRAQNNTYDTAVIEKVAPAVVHERIHQDTHYVREEVITREVHNHDVYHRILPVIDVEVLPPRHFLPVEGGGLVEISGKEVPGRGNNWVIAETASRIPSDQPAPVGQKAFSARQFLGSEGDTVQYTAPEGHQMIEQTWIHPPELETGGRDSGQTWPMEFGGEKKSKAGRGRKTSKSSKTRHVRNSLERA